MHYDQRLAPKYRLDYRVTALRFRKADVQAFPRDKRRRQ
jgi:hypothetical protein